MKCVDFTNIVWIIVFVFVVYSYAYSQQTYLLIDEVSGGEDHTLILMKNGTLWSCGNNTFGQLGYGYFDVLPHKKLEQVLDGDMGTDSGFLENIIAMDGGWRHSLALEPNGVVWSWGRTRMGSWVMEVGVIRRRRNGCIKGR